MNKAGFDTHEKLHAEAWTLVQLKSRHSTNQVPCSQTTINKNIYMASDLEADPYPTKTKEFNYCLVKYITNV